MVMNFVAIEKHPAGFDLRGELDFTNVMPLYRQGKQMIAAHGADQPLQIDFSQLSAANSAAIALMIDWKRYAQRSGKTLQFIHLSPQILSLLNAAEMESLL